MEDVACRSPEDTIFTIGHSTRTLAEFMSLLEEVQVDLVVDVRLIPCSRTNPQFNLDVLPEALAAAGIGYRHLLTLGGRRPPSTIFDCGATRSVRRSLRCLCDCRPFPYHSRY